MDAFFQFTRNPEEEYKDSVRDEFGVLYSWDRERLLKVPSDFKINEYENPEGTLFIAQEAFKKTKIKKLNFPKVSLP